MRKRLQFVLGISLVVAGVVAALRFGPVGLRPNV
jgi:hypothetical protein